MKFLHIQSKVTEMKSTCIIVYGNIASGKSTVSKMIKELLPSYTYVCLDDIRLSEYMKDSKMNKIEREKICQGLCIDSIMSHSNVIYETTGASIFFDKAQYSIKSKFDTDYIYIQCPANICASRYEDRMYNGHTYIPLPHAHNKPARTIMHTMEEKHQWLHPNLTIDSDRLDIIGVKEEVVQYINKKYNSHIYNQK